MILVDIDGTIAQTGEYLYEKYGIPLEVYPAPLPAEFWAGPRGLEVFMNVEPMRFAAEALSVWGEDVIYATMRPMQAEFVTRRWLEKHGFPKGRLVFCKDLNEKCVIARKFGAFFIIEDDPGAPKVFKSGEFNDQVLFLIKRPYNARSRAIFVSWERLLKGAEGCSN